MFWRTTSAKAPCTALCPQRRQYTHNNKNKNKNENKNKNKTKNKKQTTNLKNKKNYPHLIRRGQSLPRSRSATENASDAAGQPGGARDRSATESTPGAQAGAHGNAATPRLNGEPARRPGTRAGTRAGNGEQQQQEGGEGAGAAVEPRGAMRQAGTAEEIKSSTKVTGAAGSRVAVVNGGREGGVNGSGRGGGRGEASGVLEIGPPKRMMLLPEVHPR